VTTGLLTFLRVAHPAPTGSDHPDDHDPDALRATADVPRPDGVYATGYFETRLAKDANREKVWRHLCEYLARWIRPTDAVLELGAGWCDFSNHVSAGRVVAMDLDSTVERAAASHVQAVVGDSTDLGRFDDASFDVVFASNLLEHLERPQSDLLLAGAHRVLRNGGRLVLMQPNFRLNPGRYFDDFTHVAIFTDQSLQDYLVAQGWRIVDVKARFLPLTLKSRGSHLTFLVPWYLRSPIKPLAGQMLVVAEPAVDASRGA
jgi:SAM-dependent methyltransferase